MDTDLVRIFQVAGHDVAGGARQFLIHATLVAQPSCSLQLQTLNGFAASLCQRAKETNRPIAVEHERTPYGETLRAAHFLKAKEVA